MSNMYLPPVVGRDGKVLRRDPLRPELEPVPLSEADARQMKTEIAAEIATALVESHGLAPETAKALAAQQHERIKIEAGNVGLSVQLWGPEWGIAQPYTDVNVRFFAAQVAREAQKGEEEEPPRPLTDAEYEERFRRQSAGRYVL